MTNLRDFRVLASLASSRIVHFSLSKQAQVSDFVSFGRMPVKKNQVGLDVFYFQPNIARQTVTVRGPGGALPATLSPINVDVVGIGFDVLKLRLHLAKDEKVPMGRVQPMVSIGLAVFVTDSDQSINSSTALGFKAAGGLQVLFTKVFGVFAEYRYTRFTAEPDIRFGFATQNVETTVSTHHLVGGLALHF